MRILGYSWMGIYTEDFEAAIGFFAEKLGLPLEWREQDADFAAFRLPSGQLFEVCGPRWAATHEEYNGVHPTTSPILGLEVEDVEAAREELMRRGVEFVTEAVDWGEVLLRRSSAVPTASSTKCGVPKSHTGWTVRSSRGIFTQVPRSTILGIVPRRHPKSGDAGKHSRWRISIHRSGKMPRRRGALGRLFPGARTVRASRIGFPAYVLPRTPLLG